MNRSLVTRKIPISFAALISLCLFWLSACISITPVHPTNPIQPTTTATVSHSQASPTPIITPITPSLTPTLTPSFGPSPTSSPQAALEAHAWKAVPVMIEAAILAADTVEPFGYTPFFVLYGDGLLVTRSCAETECTYLQSQLSQEELCLLVNTMDRTGFLHVNPQNSFVPPGTGTETRLNVQLYLDNFIQIQDLDRWIEKPNWYPAFIGCQNCFTPPKIDPAIINLFRLLKTFALPDPIGLQTDRLALWLTQPVIEGTPQRWDDSQISLASLAENSLCPDSQPGRQAVVLEGAAAYSMANFLSGQKVPLFTDGQTTWQVQSRWLLPYETPQTCDHPHGLHPPAQLLANTWHCEPAMGAIPTATSTITPTPTITPTTLR